MAAEEWLERVRAIRTWSRGGERAPHKPLLLLFLLGRLARTGSTEISYAAAEPELKRLLEEFGPPRTTSPAYPFHHLQTDGLWTVQTSDGSATQGSAGVLRRLDATGRLTPAFEAALQGDPRLVAMVVRYLLDRNFPESAHGDICTAVGVDVEATEVAAAQARVAELRRRDPQFRGMVLTAYEFRCAMCGYDGRLGTEAVGLDAAHVRWWAADGPDSVENALCLCSFHHKLLDRGAIGIAPDHTVAVSMHFVGRGETAQRLVLGLVGKPVLEAAAGPAVSRRGARGMARE